MYAFARGAASTCGCASAEGRRHPEPIPISVVRETARATQRRRIVETASLNHRGLRGKAEELQDLAFAGERSAKSKAEPLSHGFAPCVGATPSDHVSLYAVPESKNARLKYQSGVFG